MLRVEIVVLDHKYKVTIYDCFDNASIVEKVFTTYDSMSRWLQNYIEGMGAIL